MKDMIITIGRQYGSGGREIGEKLANRLGISYYDTMILEKTASNGSLSNEIIQKYDEQITDKWLHPTFTMGGGYANDTENLPVSMRAVLQQFEVISEIGKNGSAVIIGRCADYVLREQKNVLSVFIRADMEYRIPRVAARNGISYSEAEKRIRNTDKHRASYYNFYTDKEWGVSDSYHLCVDSGQFGVDGTVDLLVAAVQSIT